MSSQMLPKYASKLGLSDRKEVLKSASDFLSRLESSPKVRQMKLSSSCLAVCALHAAARRAGGGGAGSAREFRRLAGVASAKAYTQALKGRRIGVQWPKGEACRVIVGCL